MEHITVTEGTPARRAAVAGLAVVGFFALVFIGMVLAIYAARFVPKAANGLSSAAVYLGSIFTPAQDATLEPVQTTVPFDNGLVATTTATTSAAAATTTATTTTTTVATRPATTAGTPTTIVVPTGGTAPAALYGLPDLAVDITAVGYLTSNDTSTFVASTIVPDGKRGAVKFTVRNAGTNSSGNWTFDAKLPTTGSDYTYHSNSQKSLLPGDRIDFVLGFDHADDGDQTVTVTVDPNNRVNESNERNDESDAHIKVED